MPIKTIIFDLGGVYFTDGANICVKKLSSEFGIQEEKIMESMRSRFGNDYRKGNISEKEFFESMKKHCKISAPAEKLAHTWHSCYEPIEEVVNIVKRLREKGYEVIFLSNNVKERVEFLQKKYSFIEQFHDGVFSHIVKATKPDIEIYQHILKKTKNKPEECVFIDDRADYLIPAEQLGMKGIHFRNAGQLEEELKGLGIDV